MRAMSMMVQMKIYCGVSKNMDDKTLIRNGITIDLKKVRRMMERIIFEENINQRTKAKTDSEMVNIHMNTIKEEINAYKEN